MQRFYNKVFGTSYQANRPAQSTVQVAGLGDGGWLKSKRSPSRSISSFKAFTIDRLDIVPAQFRVIVTRRPKYACRACEEVVVQAPARARLVDGGIPTEATVAYASKLKCISFATSELTVQEEGPHGV